MRPKEKSIWSILTSVILYLLSLWIGINMINEFKRYGYYKDYKHGLLFFGEGARIAGYGVTAVSGIGLIYTLYLAITANKKR